MLTRLHPGFEATFAPEIEAFTPPQPARDNQLSSPTMATPTTPKHQHQFSTASANGATEVSTVQPVSLRQGRGARLSFLGGRKRETPQQPRTPAKSEQPDTSEAGSNRSEGKGADSHRRSFFRTTSHENQRPSVAIPGSATNGSQQSNGQVSQSGTEASDWATDSGSHGSYDTRILASTPVDSLDKGRERLDGAGTPKLGGMKKRLSLLRLGKKTGRSNGAMGALDEE
jgi:dedicator of cytokinesis protein 3